MNRQKMKRQSQKMSQLAYHRGELNWNSCHERDLIFDPWF